jgi:Na+-translocating ferredoxin:NAD+ oxidoreductase RnfE subunit
MMILGSLLGFAVANLLSEAFVTITGYCPPYMIASSVIAALGAGFMATFTVTTSRSKWIGLQVLVGAGVGLGLSMPSMPPGLHYQQRT